ncbi:unnamed protein product [Linum tenue]|uniref:Uncharacterized protein n=1 Tax=Linum tenue TaxID=586396 RepID=A0AAV0RP42_9ROSI|nr:unnamed protein product [Linum tenue]
MAGATKLQVCVALMVAAASGQLADGAVDRYFVLSCMSPCLDYIRGKGPLVPACADRREDLGSAGFDLQPLLDLWMMALFELH